MPNRINRLYLEEYKKAFGKVSSVISFGYPGLNVVNVGKLREELRKRNFKMMVIKNRIANRAFQELGRPSIASICKGQTALALSDDPVALSRFLLDYRNECKELHIYGALVENTLLDEKGVVDLSKSPTKAELQGMLVRQILGPASQVAGALLGPARTLAGQIRRRIETFEENAAST